LHSMQMRGIWKTTTYTLAEITSNVRDSTSFESNDYSDALMCQLLGECLNLTWMAHLKPELYFDNLHFVEPVYRILNEDLLQVLGKLPDGYDRLDRSAVLLHKNNFLRH